MKRAIVYLCLAIFVWLVVQPNLKQQTEPAPERIPENTEVAGSSSDQFTETSQSKSKIVIDPGRGASDVGYDAPGQISEKEVAMQVAIQIGKALESAGYAVEYTRWYDSTEGWDSESGSDQNRLSVARNAGADYLLALRFNSGDTMDKGFSLFTRPDDPQLYDLASEIADNIRQVSYSTYQGLDTDHYENFPILSDEQIPSILIQMGYLSNEQDYAKITDAQFQEKIGTAIAQAFLDTVN